MVKDATDPAPPAFTTEQLAWTDEDLGSIAFPTATMHIRASFGSGLTRRAGDPPDIVWAVGDRGPNVKPKVLLKRYGVEAMSSLADKDGAKVMPRLDLGPSIARLRIHDSKVELLETLRLRDAQDEPVCGLPPETSDHARTEPTFDLKGNPLEPSPSGLDTEGIVAFRDGGFLLGDEFGPSLVRVEPDGRVMARHVPNGTPSPDGDYAMHATLPAIAAKRQLNRGFEALALSPDERTVFLAFQSPLAHPDEDTHEAARHVRLWRMDAVSLEVQAQYAYPLDPPESFLRDAALEPPKRSDLKVCELVACTDNCLLALERCSQTTKIYRVDLNAGSALPPEHLDRHHRPTLEEMSAAGDTLPELRKTLLFSSDHAPDVAADMEGMVVLSPTELLLVSDNDFGCEGAETCFWRIRFAEPVLG